MNKKSPTGHYAFANLTLGLVGVGLIISYPVRTSFGGGLAFSTFSAAAIAGLADWFAVTALFRRPLGIRPGRILRTDIISRNRERIFQSLSEMVESLLSKEALLDKLSQYHIARFLVKYLSEPQTLNELNAFWENLSAALDLKPFLQNLAQVSEHLLSTQSLRPHLESLLKEILSKSQEQGFERQAASFLAHHLQNLVTQPEVFAALQHVIEAAYHTYEADHTTRKWVDALLPSPPELAKGMQKAMVEFLSGSEPVRIVQSGLDAYLGRETPLQLSSFWASLVETLRLEKRDLQRIRSFGTTSILHALQDQPERLDALDQVLKSSISQWIDTHHSALSRIVRDKLDSLTGNDLSELIELKAGNDLQMIRINGSIIGGLAGMLMYLITTWFLRGCLLC